MVLSQQGRGPFDAQQVSPDSEGRTVSLIMHTPGMIYDG